MKRKQIDVQVLGPWSLATSRAFWEGFTPAALPAQDQAQRLDTVFRVDADWSRAEASVTQHDGTARITVSGDGDLDAAAAQVRRFLALDVDARSWPGVADRDPVLADAQARLPGLRPCGFHSPYEAAAWAVLSQRVRIVQAARLRQDPHRPLRRHRRLPAPQALRTLELDLPGWSGPTDLQGWMTNPQPTCIGNECYYYNLTTSDITDDLIRCSYSACPTSYQAASPALHVFGPMPPTLETFFVRDIVPPAQGTRMNSALQAAGTSSTLTMYPGFGHGATWTPQVWNDSVAYLRRHMGPLPAAPMLTQQLSNAPVRRLPLSAMR